jgi:hypothetical protein
VGRRCWATQHPYPHFTWRTEEMYVYGMYPCDCLQTFLQEWGHLYFSYTAYDTPSIRYLLALFNFHAFNYNRDGYCTICCLHGNDHQYRGINKLERSHLFIVILTNLWSLLLLQYISIAKLNLKPYVFQPGRRNHTIPLNP